MAYIKAISYYLPEERLSNEQINEMFPEWSVDKISSKTGIFKRAISAQNEFASDMAEKAANKLFKEHSINPSEIDFVLLCTQSPDYFLPTTACILQDRLGIPTSAGALDFNLGCSGYVYGLGLAKGLVDTGMASNVLLITSETYSKFIHPKDKSNRTIFGDASACTLISNQKGLYEIGKFVFGTDGKGANNLIVKNGGVRNPIQQNKSTDTIDEYGNVSNDDCLYMNGAEIFNFTLESVPKLVEQTLKKNETEATEINQYVLHQANKYMLNHLRKKMKIEEENFFIFLEDCGNTVSATIPIALVELNNNIKQELNSKTLLAGFGVGYSWAGTIITKV